MASSFPPVSFHAHPDLAGAAGFMTVTIDVAKVVASYQNSVFAFEWLTQDGQVKKISDMKPDQAAARTDIERLVNGGQSLVRPILGWGMMDHVEIGMGRDILLTLYDLGVRVVPVDIPVACLPHMKGFIVPDASSSQRGNVLLYILLAVVLLAALSYAVTQSSRSGSTSAIDDGRASTLATEVLTYANHVKTAVAKLNLRGCTAIQMNFANDVVAGYTNVGAPGDNSCDVFAPAGGTITWVTPTDGVNDATPWFYSGHATVHQDSGFASGNTAAEADLVMLLFGVNKSVCASINKKLGVDGIPINDGSFGDNTKFDGSFAYSEDINGLAASSQPSPCSAPASPLNFCGKDAGCFQEESGGQRYIFFQTLMQR